MFIENDIYYLLKRIINYMRKLLFIFILSQSFTACNQNISSLCFGGYPSNTGSILLQRDNKQVSLEGPPSISFSEETKGNYSLKLSLSKGRLPYNMSAEQANKLDSEYIELKLNWKNGDNLRSIPGKIDYSRQISKTNPKTSIDKTLDVLVNIESFTPAKEQYYLKDFEISGSFEVQGEDAKILKSGNFQAEDNQLSRICR